MSVALFALTVTALLSGGLLLGFALARRAPLRAAEQTRHELELRGWLQCERALYAESDDRALLAAVRTRVPPRLRLAYEQLYSQAAQAEALRPLARR